MQVVQTAGVPPRRGNTILPIMGCTKKSRVADTNRVKANKKSTGDSAKSIFLIAHHWQPSDANALRLHRNHGALTQILGKVGYYKNKDFGEIIGLFSFNSQSNHRRGGRVGQGQKGVEIGIQGDDCSLLRCGFF